MPSRKAYLSFTFGMNANVISFYPTNTFFFFFLYKLTGNPFFNNPMWFINLYIKPPNMFMWGVFGYQAHVPFLL